MQKLKIILLFTIAILLALILWLVGPMPQSQSYHQFADVRGFLHLPNFLDVMTNLVFLIIGGYVTYKILNNNLIFQHKRERWFYLILYISLILIAFGSAYYHWNPNNTTLVWDRLPIAVAVMAFFASQIAERISLRAGLIFLPLLIVFGLFSVIYWHSTEIAHQGDLRIYIFIQLYPIVAIPLMLLLFKSAYTQDKWIGLAILSFVLARVAEGLDAPLYHWTGHVISGHSIKHLLAALASYFIWVYLKTRRFESI